MLVLWGAAICPLQAANTLLVLHSYHSGYWWTDDQADGIHSVLDNVPNPIETRSEFIDLLRHDGDSDYRDHLMHLLRAKYAQESIPVVLTTDEPALKFAIEYRAELFPEATIVFSGLHGEVPAFARGQHKVTGVVETRNPTSALTFIRRFHPRFSRALVIYDPLAQPVTAYFRPDFFGSSPATPPVEFTLMSFPEFEAAIGDPEFKPNPEVVLLLNPLRHSPVEKTEIDQQVRFVSRFADVPIYHVCSPTLGAGSVGGDLYSGRRQGIAAATLALRILKGEKAERIPVQSNHFARFVVDFPEFQRWGLNPKALEQDRDLVVVNRPFSFYTEYPLLVGVVSVVIVVLSLLVAVLGWTIIRGKRVARSLTESERRLEFTQFAVDHSALGILWMDAQGELIYANAAACKALEYPADELMRKTVFDFDQTLTPERLKSLWLKLRRQASVILESEHRSRTGRVYPVEMNVNYLEHNGREFLCFFTRDISDRKTTEVLLREERNLLRTLIDNLPDLIYIKDPRGRFMAGNRALAQLLGVKEPRDLIGCTDADFFPPDLAERYARNDGEVIRSGQPLLNQEELVRSASGEDFWFITSKLPLRGQDGQVLGLVGIGRNTTEHKQALDALRASEDRLRLVVAGAPIILFAVDAQGVFTLSDGKGLALLNVKSGELVGRNLFDYFWDAPQFLADVRRALDGDTVAGQHEIRDRIFETFLAPIRSSDGQVIGTTGLSTDITDRQKAEQQLLRSQKMEAIGKLAGGVAHDFNNILTGILGYAHIVVRQTEPGSALRVAGETIEKAAERAAELTKQLLGFARQGKQQNIPVDFHAVVREVIGLLSRTFNPNIRLVQRLQAASASIQGDPSQLQQVVLNLTVNARDAMPEGGELSFVTEEKYLDGALIRQQPGVQPGRYLLFALTDSGHGIPWEIQQRVFEPFFTTKEAGKGTGMGLAMVYTIVKNHGGFIQLESAEGKGTTFRIYLPLSAAAAPTPASAPEPAIPRGQGRVLVIDDDEMIRTLSARLLVELGYAVVTASSAVDGLSKYRAAAGDIDLVLVDMSMPVMDGQTFFRTLRAYDSQACVVLFSGMRLDAQIQALMKEGLAGYIQKPYKLNDLAEVLRQALARRSAK